MAGKNILKMLMRATVGATSCREDVIEWYVCHDRCPVVFGGSEKTISLSVRVVGEIQATGLQLEGFLDRAVDAMEVFCERLDRVLYSPN
jgi:hypothetical protein